MCLVKSLPSFVVIEPSGYSFVCELETGQVGYPLTGEGPRKTAWLPTGTMTVVIGFEPDRAAPETATPAKKTDALIIPTERLAALMCMSTSEFIRQSGKNGYYAEFPVDMTLMEFFQELQPNGGAVWNIQIPPKAGTVSRFGGDL